MPLVATFAAFLLALTAAPASSPQPKTAASPLAALNGKTIVVDPGHNGANWKHPEVINRLVPAGGFKKACDTTGTATADERLSEASFTWDVSRRLRVLLRRAGAKVVFTRRNNHGVGPCVNQRASIGNRAHADAAISVHGDGGPPDGRGFHVIRPGLIRGRTGPIVKPSKALALDLRAELDRIGLARANYIGHNGLDRRTDLAGLNLSRVPKVFVELGNMQNVADERRVESARWRERMARALRDGLARFVSAGKAE